jgi:hypothetical protein
VPGVGVPGVAGVDSGFFRKSKRPIVTEKLA